MKQLTEIIQNIHRCGQASVPLSELTNDTIKFLKGTTGVYGCWLPDSSVNLVIALQGPNATAPHSTVKLLGRHNFYRWVD